MHPTVYDPNVKKNNYNSIKNLKKIKNQCDLIFVCINLNKKNIKFINKNFSQNLNANLFLLILQEGK